MYTATWQKKRKKSKKDKKPSAPNTDYLKLLLTQLKHLALGEVAEFSARS